MTMFYCVDCEHEWEGSDPEECPQCGSDNINTEDEDAEDDDGV